MLSRVCTTEYSPVQNFCFINAYVALEVREKRTRPTLSQFLSHKTTVLSYIKFADLLILRL